MIKEDAREQETYPVVSRLCLRIGNYYTFLLLEVCFLQSEESKFITQYANHYITGYLAQEKIGVCPRSSFDEILLSVIDKETPTTKWNKSPLPASSISDKGCEASKEYLAPGGLRLSPRSTKRFGTTLSSKCERLAELSECLVLGIFLRSTYLKALRYCCQPQKPLLTLVSGCNTLQDIVNTCL